MTTPDQVDVVTQRNQVLEPLVGTGSQLWYQLSTDCDNPDFTVTLLCTTSSFTYSDSDGGNTVTVPIGAGLELEMKRPILNLYIVINDTLTLITG